MEEEKKVGFDEHVFLDHLIADFPKRGPVHHFMELVVVGLSQNPYFTVQQKKDHVQWFRDYFKDKQHIIDEVVQIAGESKQKEIKSWNLKLYG